MFLLPPRYYPPTPRHEYSSSVQRIVVVLRMVACHGATILMRFWCQINPKYCGYRGANVCSLLVPSTSHLGLALVEIDFDQFNCPKSMCQPRSLDPCFWCHRSLLSWLPASRASQTRLVDPGGCCTPFASRHSAWASASTVWDMTACFRMRSGRFPFFQSQSSH